MFHNNSRLSKWYISKNILASLILHIKLHQMLNATLDQGEVVQRCLSYPTCKQRGRESKMKTVPHHTPSTHPLVNFIVVGINDQPANILNFYSLAK